MALRSESSSQDQLDNDAPPCLSYRAELKRRSALGTSTYYESGELCPYTLDTLIETVHAESLLNYVSLELTVEIAGGCPQAILDAIARKFADATGPKVRVVVRGGKDAWMLESFLTRGNRADARGSS
jgi:hypothetical protein